MAAFAMQYPEITKNIGTPRCLPTLILNSHAGAESSRKCSITTHRDNSGDIKYADTKSNVWSGDYGYPGA